MVEMEGLLFTIPNAGWILKHKSRLVDILWIVAGALSLVILWSLTFYFFTYNSLFMTAAAISEVILVAFTGWIAGFSEEKWWLLFNAVACTVAVVFDPYIYSLLSSSIQMDFWQSLVGNTAIFFFGLVGYYLGSIHSYEIKLGGVSIQDLAYLIPLGIVAAITIYLYYVYAIV